MHLCMRLKRHMVNLNCKTMNKWNTVSRRNLLRVIIIYYLMIHLRVQPSNMTRTSPQHPHLTHPPHKTPQI